MVKGADPKQARLMIPLFAGCVTLIALLAYLLTLAPTICWRNGGADSGDLAAAVATLGIPHPPGYPTYVLLGWAWAALPWGGDLAYRLNLLSAVSAAGAAGVSTLTLWFLGGTVTRSERPRAIGAILGALLLALAPLTWSQATIAEVYGPGLAGLSLVNLLLFRRSGRADPGTMVLVGVAAGLSLGLLPQLGLALVGLGGLIYFKQRAGGAGPAGLSRQYLALGLGLALGLSTFAYLPIRAAAQPPANWGDPSTPARFWDVVMAAQYRDLLGQVGPADWLNRLLAGLSRLTGELSWAGVGLAAAGTYGLWKGDRASAGYYLSLIGLTLLFSASYPVAHNLVYLLPALYGLAHLAGLGAAWLLTIAQGHIGRNGATLFGLALVLAAGWRAVQTAPLVDASAANEAALFSQQVLAGLPAKAIILSRRDETTFSLWYRQALGERLDVVVVDERLLFYPWYQRNLTHHYPDLNAIAVSKGELIDLGRPVYILTGLPGEAAPRLTALSTPAD